MKHIFLTGDIGCGKSTLIRRVLETAGSQITVAGGFLTGFENNQRFGPRKLYMCNAKNFSDPQFLRQPVFSQVYGGQAAANLEAFGPPQIIRETFEDFGVSLIEAGLTTALNADKAAKKTVPKVPLKNNNNGGSVPVLIFDECGYMEAEAPLFRQAVIRSLDSPVPILGCHPTDTPAILAGSNPCPSRHPADDCDTAKQRPPGASPLRPAVPLVTDNPFKMAPHSGHKFYDFTCLLNGGILFLMIFII